MKKLVAVLIAIALLVLPLDFSFARGGGRGGGGRGGSRIGPSTGSKSVGGRKDKKDLAKKQERLRAEESDSITVREIGRRSR